MAAVYVCAYTRKKYYKNIYFSVNQCVFSFVIKQAS